MRILRAVPEQARRISLNPPFRIPCTLDAGGFFTMAVDRPDGRRARNIVAREQRPAGGAVDGPACR